MGDHLPYARGVVRSGRRGTATFTSCVIAVRSDSSGLIAPFPWPGTTCAGVVTDDPGRGDGLAGQRRQRHRAPRRTAAVEKGVCPSDSVAENQLDEDPFIEAGPEVPLPRDLGTRVAGVSRLPQPRGGGGAASRWVRCQTKRVVARLTSRI